jgi:branched-chain amino acid transport system ATP-binding protein
MTFLLAEQNTFMALRYADSGYVLENGRVVMDGTAESLAANEDVKEFYLGAGNGRDGVARRTFRDTRSYKRRKRWLA